VKMSRRRSGALLPLAVVFVLGMVQLGCVDSRCTRNSECPTGEICEASTGACVAPECTSDGQCPQGTVCKDFACIAGCRTSSECADKETCFDHRCVEQVGACECPAAPSFCEQDVNPRSPTAGQEVCTADAFPKGVMLFFGSVKCGHCRNLYDALVRLQAELEGEGEAPRIVFMQLKDVQVDADDVESALDDDAVAPIIQDTDELGLWTTYDADWYHVVLIDRHGCLSEHLGPLTDEQVDGDLHETLKDAWRDAMDADCAEPVSEQREPAPEAPVTELLAESPEILEIVDEIDVVTEISDATEADLADTNEVSETDDAVDGESFDVEADLEATEAVLEAVEVAVEAAEEPAPEVLVESIEVLEPVEVAPEAFVEPFELQDKCQVVAAEPCEVGDVIPHFLCMDINPTSPSKDEAVSELSLGPKVWVAYFGSCT
jgi:Cys-rich repeat protein